MAHRVVIDTNVLIAALRSRAGASSLLLVELSKGTIEAQLSVPLYLQYVELVARQQNRMAYSRGETAEVIAYICDVARHHRVHYLIRPSSMDAGDDMVLELAFKAGAEFIVTHNVRHFAEAERYGVQAVRPIELLRILGARP